MPNPYAPKTKPFPHQQEIYERTRDLEARALFLEMGTGKTKIALDTAGHLFMAGKIDGLLVLAPNAVAPNWTGDEIPTHLADEVRPCSHLWISGKAGTKKHANAAEAILEHDGLAILVMSYSGFMTDRGAAFAKKFLQKRTCLYVLDESARIKEPKTKRAKRVLASARYAPYRRVLTGTPVANSPFDVYTQLRFLDSEIWKPLGCSNFYAFKTRFGVFVEQRLNSGVSFKKLVRYRDLDTLHGVVDSIGERVLKDDVLDLPPKLYSKRFFDLSKEQAKTVADLRSSLYAQLDGGAEVTTPLAIVQMIRFQQILSGYVTVDEEEIERIVDDDGKVRTRATKKIHRFPKNPRLAAFMEIVEDCPHKLIVWARFHFDCDEICAALEKAGIPHVRFDGTVGDDDREHARVEFQKGDAKVFVGNPACAGEGLTLHAAKTVVYYSNSFKLTDRQQSEDRAHRIGQDRPVQYVDLIANGSLDEKIVAALRDKRDVASQVTGDTLKDWI